MRNTFYRLIFAFFVSILSEANSHYMLIDLVDEEYKRAQGREIVFVKE